ncbi:MAG: SH3 domain-containing protein [Oscillibacter sp.]|nr:SH3 domain-containing protein [Oscillibacter sp.]
MKKLASFLTALCLFASLVPARAADVSRLPGVTEEMCDPDFWAERAAQPDALLASAEELAQLNAAGLSTAGANMHDLKNLSPTFDGVSRIASLRKGVLADGAYYLGWTYSADGKKLEQADFDRIADNCFDRRAARSMPLRYGIAVNRTELLTFPYDGQILDDPADLDFDYQPLVGIRVNEPVAVFTDSEDGKYYQVCTSCCSGWVRAEDIALCSDRDEWLSAWDLPAEKRLVFYGDKMYTDYSRTSPETSGRLITMGTVLERADVPSSDALVINRLPIHNYAVYLPVRTADGTYAKVPALLNAREKLSEDYLPLTLRNLAEVALTSLGDAYGWGAGLNNEDCSSLNRSVYLCFGLDLPRNGNWQWPLPIPKADVTYATTEEKLALLDEMPLGTLLTFPGHQMMYLGKVDGEYYLVSTVSSMMSPETGKRQRSRNVQINKVDLRRANGQTWIEAVNRIYLPYLPLAQDAASPLPAFPWYHAGTAYCLERKLMDSYDGGFFKPLQSAARAEAVEALWRLSGKPEPSDAAPSFSDVDSGAPYEKAVRWAREQGIAAGVDGAFLPNGTLTREQFAVLLYRAAGEPEADANVLAPYRDAASLPAWSRSALAWCVGHGILCGTDAQTLAVKSPLTRAQLAVLLLRVRDAAKAAEA